MAEKINALMLVLMDSDFIGKVMFTSMVRIDVWEHAPVMIQNSSLMKNTIPARTSSVLRVVDQGTALRSHINALMHGVHTD